MAQRLNFAQAILHDPELVILDEPFSGLDPFGRMDLRNIILDLKNQGKTIFFSSHILEDAEFLADEVIFLNKGKLIHQGSKAQTYENLDKNYQIHITGNRQNLEELAKKYSDAAELKDDILLLRIDQGDLNTVLSLVNTFKLSVLELEKNDPKLEDAFLKKFSEYE
jgi:ABC-2 type transport system ATP-binding protein